MTQFLKRMMLTITALLVGSASALVPLNQALAVSGSDWRAGRIVDDGVFTDANSMNVQQIQAFLNQLVPNCDTWGTQPSEYGGGTRAQYAASRGNPTPFTCLKDYYEVPKTTPGAAEPASNYGGAPIPPGAQSAAQLIANAAVKYSISPKVLLVKLATESAGPLTSDDWPFKRQYLYAMGAHCPDSGPGGAANCDANWAGFSLQMDEAAALLRWYLDSMTQPWWQYKKPYQNNSILWRVVESGCGASNIYIESKATAALYTYTPYQPNQAALNNLYGTGDGCSSYGNRNFWRVFNDWFGSSIGTPPNYIWNFETLDGTSQSVSAASGVVGNYPYSVDLNGSLHTFYYDVQGGNLKHAWIASGAWNFETLDGAGGADGRVNADVGGFTKALLFNGELYVFYKDFQNGDLRMATHTASGWNFETLDGAGGADGRVNADVGWDIDATADATSLHVFYSDATGGNLQHAWKTSSSWSFETLDGDSSSVTRRPGNIGQGIKSQFIGNSIHLFYYDGSATNLVHGWIDPTRGWRFEYLDGSSQSVSGFNAVIGLSPSFVFINNSFHVYYHDIDRGALRHAWFDPARGWRFEHLDGVAGAISKHTAHVGLRSTVVMEGPVMNVFYYNGTSGAVRHAWFDSTGWHFLDLDGGGSYSVGGSSSSMGEAISAVLWGGNVQVFYFNATNQTFRHAWGAPR